MTRPLTVEAEPAFRTRHANPYNASLYRAMQGLGVRVRDLSYLRLAVTRVDIVHLHWPSLTFLSGHRQWRVFARLVCFFGALRVARLRGTRVVWTVHNVEAHEQRSTPRLRSWYRRLLLANVDGILALTHDGVDAARRAHPELAAVPAFVTPHGHYRDDYDFSIGRDAARERLALPDAATVVLTVGQVRPYKNVPHLIRTFAGVDDAGAVLAVAGRPSAPALADGDPRRRCGGSARRDRARVPGRRPPRALARRLRPRRAAVLRDPELGIGDPRAVGEPTRARPRHRRHGRAGRPRRARLDPHVRRDPRRRRPLPRDRVGAGTARCHRRPLGARLVEHRARHGRGVPPHPFRPSAGATANTIRSEKCDDPQPTHAADGGRDGGRSPWSPRPCWRSH